VLARLPHTSIPSNGAADAIAAAAAPPPPPPQKVWQLLSGKKKKKAQKSHTVFLRRFCKLSNKQELGKTEAKHAAERN